MSERKILKTIAFQVDDPDFLEQYEARVKESGLNVRNYFISLIKADIEQSQAQKENLVQNSGETLSQEGQALDAPPQMDDTSAPIPGPDQEQSDIPAPQHEPPDVSEPEEMMNLFVKVTKEQREALDYHKNESGETVGNVLNRLIDKFLDEYNNEGLSDEFAGTFKYYLDNVDECDTKVSAKIPVKSNQELADYVNRFGGSRNALMSTLVHMELHSQDMAQGQDMTM
jgi:hypothetical protein